MTLLRRCAILVALILAATLTGSVSAQADAPIKQTFVDAGFATLPDINCGSFTLREELVRERVTIMTFLDSDGIPTRKEFHINFDGTLTRSDTGESFRDHVAGVDLLDPATDELLESRGVKLNLHQPSEGNFALYAGRKVYDGGTLIFNGGPRNPDFTTGNFQDLCTLLP